MAYNPHNVRQRYGRIQEEAKRLKQEDPTRSYTQIIQLIAEREFLSTKRVTDILAMDLFDLPELEQIEFYKQVKAAFADQVLQMKGTDEILHELADQFGRTYKTIKKIVNMKLS